MASLTCPTCRHVVEVEEGAAGKCRNCGALVRMPPPPFTKASASQPRPATSTAPETEPARPSTGTTHLAPPGLVGQREPSRVRAASIVSLVCGLVFFMPFVTQAVGLVAGAIAILRKRRTNERVAAAWVGIALCVFGLIGWTAAFSWIRGAKGRAGMFRVPTSMAYQDNEWSKPGDWHTEMELVYRAASAYRKDFNRWPASIEVLGGHSLPHGHKLPEDLTYYPVPEDEALNFDRLLIVSAPTTFDEEANALHGPHRMVLRLGGTIEVLPAEEVDRLLAEQSSPPAPDPP